MQVQTALLPELLPVEQLDRRTLVIVIDTLRFTTTASQALTLARQIQVASEIEGAIAIRQESSSEVLLCGERHCRPIEGFQFGNSPLEFLSRELIDKELVFTTTNGTRAVKAASQAGHIWLAALVNRRAVCRALSELTMDRVWIVCAGTDGEVAAEDVLTAGAILDGLEDSPGNDQGLLALAAWQQASRTPEHLATTILQAAGARNLVETGYQADIEFALRLDSLGAVPKSVAPNLDQFQLGFESTGSTGS